MTLLFDMRATQSSLMGPDGGAQDARAVFRALAPRGAGGRLVGFHDPDHALDPDIADLVAAHDIVSLPARTLDDIQALVDSGRYRRFASILPYNYHRLDFGDLEVILKIHGLRPLEQAMPFHGRHYAHSLPARAKWAAKYVVERLRPAWRRSQFQGLVDAKCGRLHVVVPSWHTRYSLLENLDVPADTTVHTFYSAETPVGRTDTVDPSVLERLGVRAGRFLLLVSGGRWIKNSWRALRAVTAVMDGLPDDAWLPIVVTGGAPGGLPRGRRKYVIETGYLAEAELAALYRDARALLYPSLNEGFGYPPLEAMAWGTPVLSSAITSLTEVLGDAAIYFCPHDTGEMRTRIRLAVADDELLALHVARGRRRVAEVQSRQRADLAALCDLLLPVRETS